ncbi:hypothetical protein Dsin_026398 [Dipteronia sinensis]|uniref:Uncharacterized protein n=1 Tax=Dipteronia sinensis TaxID=43782 RepID=A0AAD9ZZ63_9ROSI|nr:hypothetical protein Dsin_026398 [Dipteronia sinensis]
MIIKLFKNWKTIVITPLHAAAAFFNPAYFCSENFTEDTHEMQEGLHHLLLLVPPEEQEALSKQLKLYSMRMPDLFSDTATKNLNAIHPVSFVTFTYVLAVFLVTCFLLNIYCCAMFMKMVGVFW